MSKIKVVAVKFIGSYSTLYDFKCAEELGVAKGDVVVVDSAGSLQVAEVKEIKGYLSEGGKIIGLSAAAHASPSKATKWVIDKVDMKAHNDRIMRDAKLAALKKKMDARLKQLQTEQVYRMFAEQDDTLRELLSEFESLKQETHEESR
jgi:hypothetical protein